MANKICDIYEIYKYIYEINVIYIINGTYIIYVIGYMAYIYERDMRYDITGLFFFLKDPHKNMFHQTKLTYFLDFLYI